MLSKSNDDTLSTKGRKKERGRSTVLFTSLSSFLLPSLFASHAFSFLSSCFPRDESGMDVMLEGVGCWMCGWEVYTHEILEGKRVSEVRKRAVSLLLR